MVIFINRIAERQGKYAVSASTDGSLRIWVPMKNELLHKISGLNYLCNKVNKKGFGFHEEDITSLAFHPSQPIIISGSCDKTACISNYLKGKVSSSLFDRQTIIASEKVVGRTQKQKEGVEVVGIASKYSPFSP